MRKTKKTKFRKIIGFLTELGIMIGLMLIFTKLSVFAKEILPLSNEAKNIYESGDIPVPTGESGQEMVKTLVLGTLGYFKVFAVAIGILFISLMGLRLIMATGNEEDISKARKGLIYALIAFLIISMSQDLAKIFDMEKSTLLGSPQSILNRVHLFDKQVEIFMTFIKYVIGSYATVMIITAGIKLITSGANDEEVGKQKKSIMYSIGGLLMIYVGEIFINKVFYKIDKNVYSGITGVHPSVDAKEGVEQLAGITNFILTFVGPIALLMLIGGAIMYATAAGEEENMNKAKRLLTATVIGIVIIYGSFAIVNTIISSRLTEIGTMPS